MAPAKSIVERIGKSTFLLTGASLVLLNLALTRVDVGPFLSKWGYTDSRKEFFVAKIPALLHPAVQPDVLVTSSSLMLTPAARCDEQFLGGATNYHPSHHKEIFQYAKAQYLEQELSKALGHEVHVMNGAIAASTMSDQKLLFKTLLRSGVKPKVLFVCAAPRDFLDNFHPDPEKTQTYQLLGDLVDLGKVQAGTFSVKDSVELAIMRSSNFFRCRRDLRDFLDKQAVRLTHHPLRVNDTPTWDSKTIATENISAQAQYMKFKPVFEKPANHLADLPMWTKMYLPVDNKRMAAQMNSLDALLQTAREHDVPAVVVDMPLPKENLALLPAAVLERYEDGLAQSCTRWHADLWHPGRDREFTIDDFEDGGHMLGTGGKKLFDYMTTRLSSDNRLCLQITGRRSFIGQR
jgi:hypothetical protein